MDRLKTFAIYIIIGVLFWIISDFLIEVGINSMYKNMSQKGTTPEGIEIIQMQSTKVNGRIHLKINNKDYSGKFLKIDLFSQEGNNFGTQYIEIGDLQENEVKDIQTYFKISEIKSYEISIVDEMGETTTGFMDTAMSAMTVLVFVVKLLFV